MRCAVLCCGVSQCMELLKMYGEVKYFRLMMDRQTGNSRVRRTQACRTEDGLLRSKHRQFRHHTNQAVA